MSPLAVISAELLACALTCEHRIVSSHADFRLTLTDGQVLESRRIRAVLNRLIFIAPLTAEVGSETDRQYASQELAAFHISWLSSLRCLLINRPTAQGLCGQWRGTIEWTLLAQRAGLVTRNIQVDSRVGIESFELAQQSGAQMPNQRTLIVLRDQVFPEAAPAAVKEGCVRLAKMCSLELIGVDFEIKGGGEWEFQGASLTPDLVVGGAPFLDSLWALMSGKGEAS